MLTPLIAFSILAATVTIFTLLGVLHARRGGASLDDHLICRNRTGAGAGIATITASAVGAWVLFSPAETATWAGLAGLAGYALGQAAPLFLLAWLGPRLRARLPEGYALNEYAQRRYGPSVRVFVLGLILFYLFVYLAAEITAVAQAVRLIAGVPLPWTAAVVTAGTAIYTGYGGLRASIFTDRIQFALILPLLAAVFAGAIVRLGGPAALFDRVAVESPALLSWRHPAGVEFGITLIVAIAAANLFHQGFWQRVYSGRDDAAVRRAYALSGLAVMPVVFIAGLFGFFALNRGLVAGRSPVALFALVAGTFPPALTAAVLVLALALVMSSADTLLNGMASAIVSEMAERRPGGDPAGRLRAARVWTLRLAIPAAVLAARGYSVLYLFLIADLACAGAAVPVFYGLFAPRHTARRALGAAFAGIAAGALFFPKPDFAPWNPLPGAGRFLVSFGAALLVSAAVAALPRRRGRHADSVLGKLSRQRRSASCKAWQRGSSAARAAASISAPSTEISGAPHEPPMPLIEWPIARIFPPSPAASAAAISSASCPRYSRNEAKMSTSTDSMPVV